MLRFLFIAAVAGAQECVDHAPLLTDTEEMMAISCELMASVGMCGCAVVAGEGGIVNWYVDGVAPPAEGATLLEECTRRGPPVQAGFTVPPLNLDEPGTTLIHELCPVTCAIEGDACFVASPPPPPYVPKGPNPFEPSDDQDARLVRLFNGNPVAVCSTCAVPGVMCANDFCGQGVAALCPHTCWENDWFTFVDSGFSDLDLTKDNSDIMMKIFGPSEKCEEFGFTKGAISACMSPTLLWSFACPEACARSYPQLEYLGTCASDDPDFMDVDNKTCADWLGYCSVHNHVIGTAQGYISDCEGLEELASATGPNVTAHGGGAPICEVGGNLDESHVMYSAAHMNEIRAHCPSACLTCVPEPEEHPHPDGDDDHHADQSCVPCPSAGHRNRRHLLFGSLPCC